MSSLRLVLTSGDEMYREMDMSCLRIKLENLKMDRILSRLYQDGRAFSITCEIEEVEMEIDRRVVEYMKWPSY